MPAQIIEMRRPSTLECSACGALGTASCDCNVGYITPAAAAKKRKARAVKLYKQGMTQEQIAATLHVSRETIRDDLSDFNLAENANSKRPKTASNPKGAGRPKGSKPKTKASTKPKTKADAANVFTREVSSFIAGFGLRFRKFVEANPDLPEEARDALSHSLRVQAEELMELAGLL